jgi:cation/acetate symporter
MATIHLSRVVAGEVFLGFISGVVFATILAVVAGLTITGAATLSHDLYANVMKDGKAGEDQELFVSRVTSVALGVIAILLAIFFEGQNIAYMIAMVFVVTASANCPILLLAIYWRGLTTRGALLGGGTGLVLAVGGVLLGPTVWVEILGNEKALFPWHYPGLFSVPAGFFFTWLGSVLDRSPRGAAERVRFESVFVEMHRGSLASPPPGR